MASTLASPGSPTGTLKRESSKKDAGKLGWVGTLTRRKKSEEKLANIKLAEFEEVTQSVESQKAKLSVLLGHVNKLLGIPDHRAKWTAKKLAENGKPERDAFDALFDNAPEKLTVVKKSLQGFVNKHLNKLSLEVADIDSQFHDGVYLIFLLGLLEGFFVPLYQFYITPSNKDEKLHNVALAIDLMRDSGMKFYAKPEDVVQKHLKSTLRILCSLFQKYKNVK